MEEYTGPKAVIDANGQRHCHEAYVLWLESKVSQLVQQLTVSKQTVAELRRKLETQRSTNHRQLRVVRDTEDYVPYHDYDDR